MEFLKESKCILFSMIETKEQVLEAEKAMEQFPDVAMMVMIETPLAILNSPDICATSTRTEVVVVGSNNLANRLQIDIKKGSKAMFNYLARIALSAKAYEDSYVDHMMLR